MEILKRNIDLTGFTEINGGDLNQLVDTVEFKDDFGGVVSSTDNSEYPVVPGEDYKTFIWRRISATGVILYVWDGLLPDGYFGSGLLKWKPINNTAAGDASIPAEAIQAGITSEQIISLAWSKITGKPSLLDADTTFDGDVTGKYNTLTFASRKITGDKIATYENGVRRDNLHPEVGAKLIQHVHARKQDLSVVTTTMPHMASVPLKTEGTQLLVASITPKITGSVIKVSFRSIVGVYYSAGTAGRIVVCALFRNDEAAAIGATATFVLTPQETSIISFDTYITDCVAGTPYVFAVRAGINNTADDGKLVFNGVFNMAGAAITLFGGSGISSTNLEVSEIHQG